MHCKAIKTSRQKQLFIKPSLDLEPPVDLVNQDSLRTLGSKGTKETFLFPLLPSDEDFFSKVQKKTQVQTEAAIEANFENEKSRISAQQNQVKRVSNSHTLIFK